MLAQQTTLPTTNNLFVNNSIPVIFVIGDYILFASTSNS